MSLIDHCRREAPLALKFGAVGCLGFVTDAVVLKLGLAAGLTPAAARLLSLFLAMQVTFTVNGLLVFRCLEAAKLPRQWAGYMGSNGLGNLCNYLIFLGLVHSSLPLLSGKFEALAIGSDEQKPALLVSVDNLGVPDAIVSEVAARLARKAGLARERLAVGSSHAHTAPMLTGVAPNIFGKPIAADEQARIDAYTRTFVDKLERVCLDALADRRPANLSWARGSVGFAANRRTSQFAGFRAITA